MDISKLLQIKQAWSSFSQAHPKFVAFLNAVKQRGFPESSVIEISIKYPEGDTMKSNIRVTEADLKLLDILKNL